MEHYKCWLLTYLLTYEKTVEVLLLVVVLAVVVAGVVVAISSSSVPRGWEWEVGDCLYAVESDGSYPLS